MSEFMRRLRERVDSALKPHVDVYGPDAPVVKMGLRILAEAETLEAELSEERVSTERAQEITGWNAATLQRHARAKLAGEPLPDAWAGLEVENTAAGYLFTLGSIPRKSAA